jgi:hypothetical protein
MMLGRRDLGVYLMLCLTVSALGPLAAGAAGLDPRVADNPALGRIADADPAEAQRLLNAIDQVLRQPPKRGSSEVDDDDEALLAENPLLAEAYYRDARATLELLKRIKAAGSARQ